MSDNKLREAAENILAVSNWEAFHKAREVLRAALADSADAPEGKCTATGIDGGYQQQRCRLDVGHELPHDFRPIPGSADAPEGPYKELKADRDRLRAALIEHRADLHGGSSRPCATCRQSAEALGIDGLVPGQCSRKDTDRHALNRLDAQQEEG